MGLFDGLSTPQYQSPVDLNLAAAKSNENFANNFANTFNQAANRAAQRPLIQAQAESMTLDLANRNLMLDSALQAKAGQTLLAGKLAEIAKTGRWNDPSARAEIFDVGRQYPGLVGSPVWQNTQENFLKSDKAAADAEKYKLQAEALQERMRATDERLALEKERNVISQERANQGSPELRRLDEARQKEIMAEQARKAGDVESYQNLTSEAQALRSTVGKSDNGGIVVGMDDNNRPVVTIGGPGKSGKGATVGTLSRGQEKMVKYENATQLLNTLSSNLRPMDVGAAGVVGEYVGDRILPQIPGFEGSLSGKRVENRAILGAARESLMREISDDTRFSNKDREDISKILPSNGIFESHGDALKRISTVQGIIADRARTYAERIGEPVPMFAQTKDEIRATTQKRVSAIKKSLASGTITQEQADAEIKRETDEAINALVKFH